MVEGDASELVAPEIVHQIKFIYQIVKIALRKRMAKPEQYLAMGEVDEDEYCHWEVL